jgi:site-specific DNA-cytosine methylase
VANLFDRPGEKFGTAHHRERDIIRAHLARRLGPVEPRSWDFFHREQRVNAIQSRLHRYDETFAVRSRRWANEQRLRCIREAETAKAEFTWEELERMAEHFEGANDPISAEIGRKVRAVLDNRDEELREASIPSASASRSHA